jgi:hypothetical protein
MYGAIGTGRAAVKRNFWRRAGLIATGALEPGPKLALVGANDFSALPPKPLPPFRKDGGIFSWFWKDLGRTAR